MVETTGRRSLLWEPLPWDYPVFTWAGALPTQDSLNIGPGSLPQLPGLGFLTAKNLSRALLWYPPEGAGFVDGVLKKGERQGKGADF